MLIIITLRKFHSNISQEISIQAKSISPQQYFQSMSVDRLYCVRNKKVNILSSGSVKLPAGEPTVRKYQLLLLELAINV